MARKRTTKKYGPKAKRKIEKVIREYSRGQLRSGRSGKKVRNPKQAIAIGISEARKSGAKVPPPRKRKRSR
jgi:hypothetical protein